MAGGEEERLWMALVCLLPVLIDPLQLDNPVKTSN